MFLHDLTVTNTVANSTAYRLSPTVAWACPLQAAASCSNIGRQWHQPCRRPDSTTPASGSNLITYHSVNQCSYKDSRGDNRLVAEDNNTSGWNWMIWAPCHAEAWSPVRLVDASHSGQRRGLLFSCRRLHVVQRKSMQASIISALLLYKILEKILLPLYGISKDNFTAYMNGVTLTDMYQPMLHRL